MVHEFKFCFITVILKTQPYIGLLNVYASVSAELPCAPDKNGDRDNLGIISQISKNKNIFCDPSLEPSR